MNMLCTTATALAFALPAAALAQQARLGDHPAVVVQRLHAKAGYDYASKFYPHPAWLYLASEAPRPMLDHPAVAVFKRQQHVALTADAAPAAKLDHPAVSAARRQQGEVLATAAPKPRPVPPADR